MIKKRTIILGSFFVVLILSILYLIFIIIFSEPGYISFTNQFWKEMKDKADIPAIRIWLNSMPAKDDAYDFTDEPKWSKLPECIKILSPTRNVRITIENDDYKIVRITWGGGFALWGLVVGPEDMETPKSDLEPPSGEYRVPLEPGAYVFHEIQ